MIPQFPQFKKLTLSDRIEVESLTKRFPPYSDFNFTSMWCWDTEGKISLSLLNNNLVIRFIDYITGKPFFSFIGDSLTTETALEIIDYSIFQGNGHELKLVPQSVVDNLDETKLKTEEDRDNFDYLYPLVKLSKFDGNKLRAKRNFSNRFKSRYIADFEILDLEFDFIKKRVMELFQIWALNKNYNPNEVKNERAALLRFLTLTGSANLQAMGLYIKGALVAFSFNEVLPDKYAIIHFEKANENIVGIYSYLMEVNSINLLKKGAEYLNFEQDLGILGLRQSKSSFFPTNFLKKYKVTKLST